MVPGTRSCKKAEQAHRRGQGPSKVGGVGPEAQAKGQEQGETCLV